MNECCKWDGRRTVLGAVAFGILTWSVAVSGAPVETVRQKSVHPKEGYPSLTDVPVGPPVHAYRLGTALKREGLSATEGLPAPVGTTDAAGTPCRDNVACDDCLPCTVDVCIVPAGQIEGTCGVRPDIDAAECANCSDGAFCNGIELCGSGVDSGVCLDQPDPCDSRPGTVCDPRGGGNQTGECATPCANDGDCDDGLACTGVEVCMLPEGFCRSLGFPCGSVAGCTEVGGNAICTVKGRCCTDDGNGDFVTCNRTTKSDCTGRWSLLGDIIGLPGDEGADPFTGGCLALADPSLPNAGESFLCPIYAASIDSVEPSQLTLVDRKIGVASCNGTTDIGDDYLVAGAAPGDFVEVTTVRLVTRFDTASIPGRAGSAQRYRLTFYDRDGQFIEDVIIDGAPIQGGNTQLRTVIIAEKPIVPAEGFLVVKASPRFGGFARHQVAKASSIDTGTNDLNKMWLNGGPCTGASCPLPPGEMALAFEIVGNIVPSATGACCDGFAGCNDALPWTCEVPHCDGNRNVICDPDSQCQGGTCNGTTCVGGTNAGAACDTGADCVAAQAGTVCEPPGVFRGAGTKCRACDNNPQTACASDADCPSCINVPGTCSDIIGLSCTTDADCLPNGGRCLPLPCDVDVQCPGGQCLNPGGGFVCVGGINDTLACDQNFDCGTGSCVTSVTGLCPPIAGACVTAACCEPNVVDPLDPNFPTQVGDTCRTTTAGSTCAADHPTHPIQLAFGTGCGVNECPQAPITYDDCVTARAPGNVIHVTVPAPGAPPITRTVTGDNSGATFGDNDGAGNGSCQLGIFNPNGLDKDRGNWVGFTTTACANIRLDFCGTAELSGEIKQPVWAGLMLSDCNPCTAAIGNAVVGFPVGTEDSDGDRGGPFCRKDDLWQTYGPVPPGVYSYPIFSGSSGTFGQYQFHITAEACKLAACCLPESLCVSSTEEIVFDLNGNTVPCTVDGECNTGAGETCSFCALDNVLNCDAVLGKWNGFGRIPVDQTPITSCQIGQFGACDLGACCAGPGSCADSQPQRTCDRNNRNPNDCLTRTDCSAGETFKGSALCDDIQAPCPSCTIAGQTNCHLPDTSATATENAYQSDIDAQGTAGVVSADDFIPAGTTVTSVCAWGVYLDPSLTDQLPFPFDCTGDSAVQDEFRVRIYLDGAEDLDPQNPGDPARRGLPGELIGESLVTGGNIQRGPEQGTAMEVTYDVIAQGYTLTLDTPITTLQPGKVHWIEIANNTANPEDNGCVWHWLNRFPDDARDAYAAVGISPGGITGDSIYVDRSGRGGVDMAFCLDIDWTDPPAPTAACWDCLEACTIETLAACTGLTTDDDRVWNRADPNCSAPAPVQPNDFCQAAVVCPKPNPTCGDQCVDAGLGEECDDGNLTPLDGCDEFCMLEFCAVPATGGGSGALVVGEGLFGYDNACASLDGPDSITALPLQPTVAFGSDIWFEYVATCTGRLVADQC
ncbi:MAG: hypothetical protein ACE5EX_04110, partial [Phycisphaerae bacterium]